VLLLAPVPVALTEIAVLVSAVMVFRTSNNVV
jgi:hypothetical protein